MALWRMQPAAPGSCVGWQGGGGSTPPRTPAPRKDVTAPPAWRLRDSGLPSFTGTVLPSDPPNQGRCARL
eukprot:11210242-Lingulodinium_polyedra.AAC.1